MLHLLRCAAQRARDLRCDSASHSYPPNVPTHMRQHRSLLLRSMSVLLLQLGKPNIDCHARLDIEAFQG